MKPALFCRYPYIYRYAYRSPVATTTRALTRHWPKCPLVTQSRTLSTTPSKAKDKKDGADDEDGTFAFAALCPSVFLEASYYLLQYSLSASDSDGGFPTRLSSQGVIFLVPFPHSTIHVIIHTPIILRKTLQIVGVIWSRTRTIVTRLWSLHLSHVIHICLLHIQSPFSNYSPAFLQGGLGNLQCSIYFIGKC